VLYEFLSHDLVTVLMPVSRYVAVSSWIASVTSIHVRIKKGTV
jgi:hypothetical protein